MSASNVSTLNMPTLKLVIAAVAVVLATPPAGAQTTSPGTTGQATMPNSDAGVAGQPGNKNGPAAKPSAGTTGAATNTGEGSKSLQDTSKIPGRAGGKSGPAVKSPSGSTAK